MNTNMETTCEILGLVIGAVFAFALVCIVFLAFIADGKRDSKNL